MKVVVVEHRAAPSDDAPVITWCRIDLQGPDPEGAHFAQGRARVALPHRLQCDRVRIVAQLLGAGDQPLGRLSGGGAGPDPGDGRDYELVHTSPLLFEGRAVLTVALELERVAIHRHPGPRVDTGVSLGDDPWLLSPQALIDQLRGQPLDPMGEERVRQLLASDDPAQMQLAAQVAVATDWREGAALLQRKLLHPSAEIRREMVTALGRLGDASTLRRLEMLRYDPDVLVQKAVREAIIAISGVKG